MLSRFGKCAQFLADECQIVVRIGKVWMQMEGQPKLLPSSFNVADLIEYAAKIEVSQSVVGIESNSALEVLRSPRKISIFIVKGSTIEQGIDFLRVGLKGTVVGVDRFCFRAPGRLARQGSREPVISGPCVRNNGLSEDAHAFVNFASLKVQDELAGDRFKPGSMPFHDHVFTIREDTQFGQWSVNLVELLAKGFHGTLQPIGRHALFHQLFYGAKADEVAEVIEMASLLFLGRNKA